MCFTEETKSSFIITEQIEVPSALKHLKLLDLFYVVGLMQFVLYRALNLQLSYLSDKGGNLLTETP